MTQNQIRYAEYLESKRRNQTAELQAERTIAETERANKAREAIQNDANLINSAHYSRMDAESERSNRARETENFRHNITTEIETNRHNSSSEAISRYAAGSGYLAAQLNYSANMARVAEETRSNLANEGVNRYVARQTAEANSVNAQANLTRATADWINANSSFSRNNAQTQYYNAQTGLSESEAFRNYTAGIRDISVTARNLNDIIQDYVNLGGQNNGKTNSSVQTWPTDAEGYYIIN